MYHTYAVEKLGAMWVIKSKIEYPSVGGLIAKTNTCLRKDVVKHGHKDLIKVLLLQNMSNLSYPRGCLCSLSCSHPHQL
jgi:hypothetical protein